MSQTRAGSVVINAFFIAAAALCSLLAWLVLQRVDYDYAALSGFYQLLLWLALAGIPLSFLALALSRELKINILVMGVASLIGVYFLEIAVAVIFPEAKPDAIAPYVQAAKAAGQSFDERDRLTVLADLQRTDARATLTISPGLFLDTEGLQSMGDKMIFPLAGLAERQTVNCNETGRWSVYPSDEYGFNNPQGSFAKDTLITIIGDSFAHGACVAQGDDIAGQLRAANLSTVTLGYGGTGPLVQLAALREYGPLLKSPVVLWLYFEGNDMDDLRKEAESSTLQAYLENIEFSQNLPQRRSELEEVLSHYVADQLAAHQQASVETDSFLSEVLRLRHLRMRLGLADARPGPYDVFDKTLRQAKAVTETWGGKLYFVYLPVWHRYAQANTDDTLFARAQVLEHVKVAGLPIIDLHQLFSQQADPLQYFPFRIHGHYNENGYRLVTQYIRQALPQELVAPLAQPESSANE